jgi:hypothetical protein
VIPVDENHLSPTTLSADGAAHDGGQAGPAAEQQPRPETAAPRSRWTAGRVVALVVGALLWISVGFLAAGGVLAVGGVLLIVGAVRRRQPDKDLVGAT